MSIAQSTMDVHVPLSTAYNQWTQFESFPEFMSGIEQVDQVDDTTTHWLTSIGGVRREFDAVVTDQLPDSHIAWHSVGELDQSGRVDFEPVDADTTRVKLSVVWQPEGFAEKAGSALMVDEGMVRGDLLRFKEFIEARGAEEGAWRGEVHGGRTEPPAARE